MLADYRFFTLTHRSKPIPQLHHNSKILVGEAMKQSRTIYLPASIQSLNVADPVNTGARAIDLLWATLAKHHIGHYHSAVLFFISITQVQLVAILTR